MGRGRVSGGVVVVVVAVGGGGDGGMWTGVGGMGMGMGMGGGRKGVEGGCWDWGLALRAGLVSYI